MKLCTAKHVDWESWRTPRVPNGIMSITGRKEKTWGEERRREEELCAQGLPFLGAVRLTHHQSPSGINKYSRTNYRQALLQRIKPTWNTACRAGHTNNNIEQQMRTTRVHHRLATFTPSWLAPVQHYKHAWIRNAGLIILWQACLLYGTLSGLLAQRGQDVADFLESEG